MLKEEPNNPWNPPHKEAKVDVIGIIRHFKDKARAKLRASLKASRERYRRALRYKDPECGFKDRECVECPVKNCRGRDGEYEGPELETSKMN